MFFKKIQKYILILTSFAAILLFSNNIQAQIADSIHHSWTVFEYDEEVEGHFELLKRCYAMSRPAQTKTNHTGKRDVYLAITRFDHDRSEEVNISAGFEYKGKSKVYVVVGDQNFEFFTRRDGAWLSRAMHDKRFIKKMLESDFVKVRSDSAFGSYAVDTYSLKGFARAYKRLKNLCP